LKNDLMAGVEFVSFYKFISYIMSNLFWNVTVIFIPRLHHIYEALNCVYNVIFFICR
jgi:hypothetical protein